MFAERLDGSVLLAGCDKSLPGMLMAAARLDLAGVFLYAGSTLPGKLGDRDLTIIDVFEGVGACAAGKITRDELTAIEKATCPGEGACGGMYTANTMASVGRGARHGPARQRRAAGARPPPRRLRRRLRRGRRATCSRKGITARQIMTKKAFENAITVVMALGGSTNAVLHLLAIAHEAQVDLTLDDFNRIGDRTPHLADVKPFGRFVMTDIDRIGGVPGRHAGAAGRRPAARRRAHRDRQDHGREPGRDRPAGPRRRDHPRDERPDPQDRRPLDPARLAGPRGRGREVRRLRRRGLRGHRPRLRRRAGRDGRRHRGHPASPATSSSSATRARGAARACARCSPSPARSRAPASARTSCCSPTAGSPAGRRACASATSRPRPPTAGPIAFVRDGDRIRLDLAARTLDLLVDEAELARRREGWAPLPPRYTTGVLGKYAKLVGSAAQGAICG